MADVVDERIRKTVEEVTKRWGGRFTIEMGTPWRKAVKDCKEKGGVVCHLTMYGENIESSDVLKRIKETGKDVIVVVGAGRVPGEVFHLADFNVAITNQPHSECAALAVFLDRYFGGKEMHKEFEGAEMKIIPQRRGKKVVRKQ